MPDNGKRLVSRFWDEVFNGGKLETIEEIVAPDYVLHDLAARKERTRDELPGLIGTIRGDIPGAEAVIEAQLAAEGDAIITRLTLRAPRPPDDTSARLHGRSQGDEAAPRDAPAGGQPASEHEEADEWVSLSGISISRVSGGQIQESWLIWEAARAERELRPRDPGWWWPPWR